MATVPIPKVEADAERRRISSRAIGKSEQRNKALGIGEGDGANACHQHPTGPNVVGMEGKALLSFISRVTAVVVGVVEMQDRSSLY